MDENIRTQGQIEFGVNVQKRIDEVQKRLLYQFDASLAFENLINYFDSDIKKQMLPKIEIIQKKYQDQKEYFLKNLKYPETTFKWGNKRKRDYIGNKERILNNNSIQECLPIIMDRLHELNILKNKNELRNNV